MNTEITVRNVRTPEAPVTPRVWLRRGLALAVASVWLYHGLANKLLGLEPRHLTIVQSVPGLDGAWGAVVLALVGMAEVLVAAWVLSGRAPRLCAAAQTAFLLSMNVVELLWARPHLMWAAGLLPVNVLFLGAAWLCAGLRHAERHGAAVAEAPAATARSQRARLGPQRAPLGPPRPPALYRLRRHPLAVRARFRHCLVLTYAFPRGSLAPLLPPGLRLDTSGGFEFVAVALVQTRQLRPAGMPRWLGRDFFLAGYRVFVRFRPGPGRVMRGLRILRSDTDRRLMAAAGNLLTHYNYRLCRATVSERDGRLSVRVRTPGGRADLDVTADLRPRPESAGPALPPGSPFATEAEARYFAGPLPWTFDYEPQTHSVIAIKGVRRNWRPRLVPVSVGRASFFDAPEFAGRTPVLASAFHVQDIDYEWRPGVRYALDAATMTGPEQR